MDGLDDFMAFNFCEDEREAQERSVTTEYPYQNQYWEDDKSDESSSSDSYWDDDTSTSDDSY